MHYEQKKEAVFRILQILWDGKGTRDEESERFTLNDIVDQLHEKGIRLERKAVLRDIDLLKEIGEEEGFRIETTRRGSRLVSRPIGDAELCFLIDCVRASRDLSDADKVDLIQKIGRLSSTAFRDFQRKRDLSDGENKQEYTEIFQNVALVNQAIESGDLLEYGYCRFGPKGERYWVASCKVCPYSLLQHNQRYYLMGYDLAEKRVIYHRMNRITDLKKVPSKGEGQQIRSIKGFERGIDPKTFDFKMPYLYAETPEPVVIRADASLMDQIVDWFGEDVVASKGENNTVTVSVRSNRTAMRYWALQYAESVEVLTPPDLRKEIREVLERAGAKYKDPKG